MDKNCQFDIYLKPSLHLSICLFVVESLHTFVESHIPFHWPLTKWMSSLWDSFQSFLFQPSSIWCPEQTWPFPCCFSHSSLLMMKLKSSQPLNTESRQFLHSSAEKILYLFNCKARTCICPFISCQVYSQLSGGTWSNSFKCPSAISMESSSHTLIANCQKVRMIGRKDLFL